MASNTGHRARTAGEYYPGRWTALARIEPLMPGTLARGLALWTHISIAAPGNGHGGARRHSPGMDRAGGPANGEHQGPSHRHAARSTRPAREAESHILPGS